MILHGKNMQSTYFANNMLRVNAPLIEIMKAMGHHNLKTTEIYLQSLPTADVVSYYEKL